MSMRRWLAKNRPQADVQVIYNVRSPQDVIFADEWRNYPVTLVAENNVTEGFIAGRLTRELLAGVPDLTSRTVMTCGPAPYMDWVEQEVKALGVTRFFKEILHPSSGSGDQRSEIHQTATGTRILLSGWHHATGGAGKQ